MATRTSSRITTANAAPSMTSFSPSRRASPEASRETDHCLALTGFDMALYLHPGVNPVPMEGRCLCVEG